MKHKRPFVLLASAAALSLALNQSALAESEAGAAAPEAPAAAQAAPTAAEAPAAPAAAAAPAETPAPAPETAAETTAEPPTAPAPEATSEAPASPGSAAEAAHTEMEKRHAEMMEQRRKRYEELRERASSVGLQLPDKPPWEDAAMSPPGMPTPPDMPAPPAMPEMPAPPAMPEMPAPPAMPEMPEMPAPAAMPAPPAIPGHAAASGAPQTAEDLDAMREERYKAMRERAAKSGVELPETPPWKLLTEEERYARWEKMRNATPEERAAMREQNWAEMRKRAAERGIELPETPPWKQAQQRREEMKAKWESYRQTIEQMTEEQREAAAAVFGKPPAPPARAMPRKMPAQTPYGRDFGAMRPPMPNRMPYPKMMPGQGAGGPSPWSRGAGDMMQPPPPPSSGYKRGW